MTIGIGDRLPSLPLVRATADGPDQIASDEYFAGRTVALFAIPGAFTPTCSARHLPGFLDKAADLKAKGVDEIACTSVNDAFVMRAWGQESDVGDAVTLLADGNAEFAQALGLAQDSSRFGMGTRSQRYSMLIEDGVVRQLNVEEPGAFSVSSAEHLLAQL